MIVSLLPSRCMARSNCMSSGQSTTATLSTMPVKSFSINNGTARMPYDDLTFAAACCIARRIRGCRQAFNQAFSSSLLNTRSRRAARFSSPDAVTIPEPKCSTSALRPSLPGATTSRAMISASTMSTPSWANVSLTSVLPEPMPPVRPTRKGRLCADTAI